MLILSGKPSSRRVDRQARQAYLIEVIPFYSQSHLGQVYDRPGQAEAHRAAGNLAAWVNSEHQLAEMLDRRPSKLLCTLRSTGHGTRGHSGKNALGEGSPLRSHDHTPAHAGDARPERTKVSRTLAR
jgi:hypothetical protein